MRMLFLRFGIKLIDLQAINNSIISIKDRLHRGIFRWVEVHDVVEVGEG